eukprot:CAMPEP_0197430690 /NCGR_PEP_ID=MMETSP1170-20131217/52305_1 /TAXON_ID=54406 /ORGANISM="Sarcinochrysis sp, Strain CCMP770" /LENGTH=36 /DNA_ID= /DNA_START= /DNA_END= /DNA_ORIENTATION=
MKTLLCASAAGRARDKPENLAAHEGIVVTGFNMDPT